ncbi:hypothetical protein [Paraburkholderia sp. J94]|uniref:hypothetical protein n=1 Tax=Paraburkholderia sp. J94 TaxID=2805441 RepID=UPI002AAF3AF7|nr:hypothetical protein [Paraburkholderia sp. J94]
MRIDQPRHQQPILESLDRNRRVLNEEIGGFAYCRNASVVADQDGGVGHDRVVGVHRQKMVGVKYQGVHEGTCHVESTAFQTLFAYFRQAKRLCKNGIYQKGR